jgi:leucyl/phenylalanyl-tRNA--protein transferase
MRFESGDMAILDDFPDTKYATEEGLLALGGDLSSQRLLSAYRKGIFPWYNPGEPILWWSPDPRCVIFPNQFKPQRSLTKSIRKYRFQFSFDRAFEDVINQCAAPRESGACTWITRDMKESYSLLHRQQFAHSIETWMDGKLVGGLYGISLGGVFFGESMFSRVTDASKAALNFLMSHLVSWDYQLIDCQITSPHLLRLGARDIPRAEFLKRLELALNCNGKPGNWRNIPLE